MNPSPLPPSLQDELAEIAFRESDPAVRARRHEDLIARHPEHAAVLRAAVAEALPSSLGPFRILALLGEGGFGRVYRAQQTAGVDRTVALKVLRNDLDSRAVMARFELERQVLASMSHDAIARFFEAGQVNGQPWFSMELVEGQTITDYCDEQRLTIAERLRLLLQVCDGVQHAHGKGIVHRDLKPANVLVSRGERGHVAKIIDFGIARATDRQLSQSMQTMLGMVLGTPEYMAPEQCGGDPLLVDARTDVYALGVMLYEVLSGQLPFAASELPRDDLVTVQRVLRRKDPPKPSTRIAPSSAASSEQARRRRVSPTAWRRAVRGDLDDIVGRAMEKDSGRRYASVADFAADLRRHLAHEPIVARPPSGVYRLRKFVTRYRGQVAAAAAIMLTLVAGVVVSVLFAVKEQQRAAENSRLAEEKGDLARSESAAKEQFAEKVREFDQLAGVVLYERAIANEKNLYPSWPHKVAAMKKWLRDDAGKLLARKGNIERTVRDLEAHALPPTAEELEADRQAHPRFAEFQLLGKQVVSLRYAQAIRDGAPLVVPGLTPEQLALDVKTLNRLARTRVAWNPAWRMVWGEEALGLALARAAAAGGYGTDEEYEYLNTLAWALLANGQDAEAKGKSAEALGNAPDNEHEAYYLYQGELERATTKAVEILAVAEKNLAELTTMVSQRRTFQFHEESRRFLHDALADLLGKLDMLERTQKADVEQRLRWAQLVQELSLHHPNARHTWVAVRAAIATNPKYAGSAIELRDLDITGLVPIGENPATHLWEFYELSSAWDGKGDPRTIAIPSHSADGSIAVTGDTGIVFVLLPGDTFLMGAQKDDQDLPNYDPAANRDERPHEVTLAPFFLSRYEMTQGQWARLWTGREDLRWPSWYKVGTDYTGTPGTVTPASPVEHVDWELCWRVMERHGLVLPSEAQWEYGCRAGTTTPWFTGSSPATIEGHVNVRDLTGQNNSVLNFDGEAFEDGFKGPAPVGLYKANPFGLFDVHGNVWEWCRDWYGSYGSERAGDGLRPDRGSSSRCIRGGSFENRAHIVRSALRFFNAPSLRLGNLGVRPARLIQP